MYDFEQNQVSGERRICKDCGEKFFLTNENIKFFESRNLSLPQRCYNCRLKRREDNKVDIRSLIGKYITRTVPEWNGDRSFVGRPVKLVDVDSEGMMFYAYPEDNFFYEKGKVYSMTKKSNDGQWKEWKDK